MEVACAANGDSVANDGVYSVLVPADIEGHYNFVFRIEGRSEAVGGLDASGAGGRSDGRVWQHHVKLTWEGFIDVQGDRVIRLLLAARGSEKLRWGNPALQAVSDVARLPAGRPINFMGEVRYGIIGEPVAGREVGTSGPPPPPNGDAAMQARFQRKMQQVQAGVRRWQAQGRDPLI